MKNIVQIILLLSLLLLGSCKQNPVEKQSVKDLPEIIKSGELVAITGYNPYSYFIYKGQLLGFEYELLKLLSKDLKLKLKIKVVKDMNKMFDMLDKGEGD